MASLTAGILTDLRSAMHWQGFVRIKSKLVRFYKNKLSPPEDCILRIAYMGELSCGHIFCVIQEERNIQVTVPGLVVSSRGDRLVVEYGPTEHYEYVLLEVIE